MSDIKQVGNEQVDKLIELAKEKKVTLDNYNAQWALKSTKFDMELALAKVLDPEFKHYKKEVKQTKYPKKQSQQGVTLYFGPKKTDTVAEPVVETVKESVKQEVKQHPKKHTEKKTQHKQIEEEDPFGDDEPIKVETPIKATAPVSQASQPQQNITPEQYQQMQQQYFAMQQQMMQMQQNMQQNMQPVPVMMPANYQCPPGYVMVMPMMPQQPNQQ